MVLTIEVTQEDIDSGYSNDCERCPVALALKRELLKDVDVNYTQFQIYNPNGGTNSYPLPLLVIDWITNFDMWDGKQSHPFTFEINIDEN